MTTQPEIIIGVISDTHGLLRPEAKEVLRNSALIIHAGDVGTPEVLEEIRDIAPTVAVRGNVDRGRWADRLSRREVVEIGGVVLYVLHDLSQLGLDPKAAGYSAVISGHSHRAMAEMRDGVLYLNPGSAGHRRFTLPVTLAELRVANGRVSYTIKTLGPPWE